MEVIEIDSEKDNKMEVIEIGSENSINSDVDTLPASPCSLTEEYEKDPIPHVSEDGGDSDGSLPPFQCISGPSKAIVSQTNKTSVKVACHNISSSEDEVSIIEHEEDSTVKQVDTDLPLAERLKLKYFGNQNSNFSNKLDEISKAKECRQPLVECFPDLTQSRDLNEGNVSSDEVLTDEYCASDRDEIPADDAVTGTCGSSINEARVNSEKTSPKSSPKPKGVSKKRKSIDNAKKLEREAKKVKKAEEQAAKKALQEEKKRLQEQKKLEKQKEAFLKSVEVKARRNQKPGECLKFIQAVIDPRILELPGSANILTLLQTAELKYRIEQQPMPYCIIWSREVKETILNEQMQPDSIEREVIENQVLVYVSREKFISLVENTRQEQEGLFAGKTLLSFVNEIEEVYPMKSITLLIQGLKQYYRNINNVNNRKFRNAVLGNGSSQVQSIGNTIKQVDVEESLVALQVQANVNAVQLETVEEIASTICSFTKAIAEAPFKKEKYHKQGFSWYAAIDSRDCVKVKESGEGIKDLWIQQLTQYNMVTKEIAQAIVAVYPTPQNLLQAYKSCAATKEAETLLQDIPIRRGAGPLSKTRRLGPELSRKIYLTMTSYNPDLNLNAT